MQKPKPVTMVRTILQTKNRDSYIPVEEILKGTGKITNKEWGQHWVNIVVLSKIWQAFLKVVKK